MPNKPLTSPPSLSENKNDWADYLEILCLVSVDKIVTSDEIFDTLFGDKSDDEHSYETEDFDDEPYEDYCEKLDHRQTRVNDIFDFLRTRQPHFSECYPFEVSNTPRSIKLKEKLSYKHYSYLGLLLSSNLNYFKSYMPHLTREFETNSMLVFNKLLPPKSQIEYFGKGNERGGVFSQNALYDRVIKLSEVLQIKPSPHLSREEVGTRNTGDGGIDLVGWLDLFDNCSNKLINLAQCACGKKWFPKQFDLHNDRLNNLLHIDVPITKTLITPSCYRNESGNWHKRSSIYNTVIIDRLRFLKSLYKKEHSKVATSNMEVINEVKNWNVSYFN